LANIEKWHEDFAKQCETTGIATYSDVMRAIQNGDNEKVFRLNEILKNLWGIEKEESNFPIITYPYVKYEMIYCSFCRKEKEIKEISLRVGEANREVKGICEDCSKTIAQFLQDMWTKE
jgi:hypothetical protein